MKPNAASRYLLALAVPLAACGGPEGGAVETQTSASYLFALTADQVHTAAVRATELSGDNGAYGAVTEQLAEPFECAKFGGLCEQVGEARAPAVIQQMVQMLLEATPQDVLQQQFGVIIEQAMNESDADEAGTDYRYDSAEKIRFNAFFSRHYGYAPEVIPDPAESQGVVSRCSASVESNTGKTFALITWSYWSNGKNFKSAGCTGPKTKRPTTISGSMHLACVDARTGAVIGSVDLPKTKTANAKSISLKWQPQWGATGCVNEFTWGSTTDSNRVFVSTSDFHVR